MEDGTYGINSYGTMWPASQTTGYWVAVRPYQGDISNPDRLTMLRGTYLGVWTDPDTGTVYVDESDHIESRSQAVAVAESRGELAIWDIENGCEILTSHGLAARAVSA